MTERLDAEVVNQGPDNHTLGIVALVTGILALVLSFCCPYIDIVLAIVAIVCGVLGYREGQNYSLAGIILGAAAILISVLMMIIGMAFFLGV